MAKLLAAVAVAAVLAVVAADGCCLPKRFMVDQVRTAIAGHNALPGANFITVAMDKVKMVAAIQNYNFTGAHSAVYASNGKLCVVNEDGTFPNLSLPTDFFQDVCVGAGTNFPVSTHTTVGRNTDATLWQDAGKDRTLALTTTGCLPLGVVDTNSTTGLYNFTTSVPDSAFNIPAACTPKTMPVMLELVPPSVLALLDRLRVFLI